VGHTRINQSLVDYMEQWNNTVGLDNSTKGLEKFANHIAQRVLGKGNDPLLVMYMLHYYSTQSADIADFIDENIELVPPKSGKGKPKSFWARLLGKQ